MKKGQEAARARTLQGSCPFALHTWEALRAQENGGWMASDRFLNTRPSQLMSQRLHVGYLLPELRLRPRDHFLFWDLVSIFVSSFRTICYDLDLCHKWLQTDPLTNAILGSTVHMLL